MRGAQEAENQFALDRARHMENGLAARGWEGELRVLGNDRPCSMAVCALILLGQVGLGVVLWMVK